MRTLALHVFSRDAPTFTCAWCCHVYSYTAPINGGYGIPIFPSTMSVISLLSTGILLFKLSQAYKASLEKGYKFVSRPILAIREERSPSGPQVQWILPYYFAYVIANALYMLFALIVGVLSPPTAVGSVINVVLCGMCDFFDLLLFFFLLLPRINTRSKLVALGLSVAAGVAVAMVAAFAPERASDCPWCSQHYPVNAVGWVYLVQGVVMVVVAALAYWRPLRAWSPRPASIIYCLFWAPIYFVCGVVLPLMQHGYPDGNAIDWGFCVLGVVVIYYYIMLVPVQYLTITRDSQFVLRNGLDEATAGAVDEPHQVEEDARYLLSQNDTSNTELVRVLGDESISLIRADELQLVRRVGVGGFGEVFEASWCGTTVAVKKLLAFALSDESHVLAEFVRELQMLARLRHPNILLLVGFCADKGSQAIVSEFCSRGSVWNALHGSPAAVAEFDMARRRVVARQVAAAMAYLHNAKILHRDLKSPNILLTGSFDARVADFGLSRTFAASTVTGIGTVAWSAPETLSAGKESDCPADVYSYGVVLWELGTGLAPFGDVPPIAVALGVMQRTLSLDSASMVPDACPVFATLLPRCIAFEANDRLTFMQVLQVFE